MCLNAALLISLSDSHVMGKKYQVEEFTKRNFVHISRQTLIVFKHDVLNINILTELESFKYFILPLVPANIYKVFIVKGCY